MDIDDALRALVAPGSTTTIPGALERLRAIESLLPDSDGLKWFDLLYRKVTEEVVADVDSGGFADLAWIAELDVVFANLYFDAIHRALTERQSAPRAWLPVFEARGSRCIAEVQYAFAGMNAHINRDLPLAVVKTCELHGIAPVDGSPQHRDYLRINDTLARVEPAAVDVILQGPLGVLARSLGTLDDVIAMWSVRQARQAAWTNAQVLWSLRHTPLLSENFLKAIDQTTGLAGRGLLVRTCP